MTTIIAYLLFIALAIASVAFKRPLAKQLLFLAASYVFYGSWGIGFLVALVATSLFNFAYGEFLRRDPTVARLWGGVAANVLLLTFFKTTSLLATAVGSATQAGAFLETVVMPLGMSFWTFQALSYLFDIYRQEEIDPSLNEFLLYMAFWPTVLMGPVCRLGNMLPQFREAVRPGSEDLLVGSKRIVLGLFMKLVLSQLLVTGMTAGAGVQAGFDQTAQLSSGLDVLFLAIGFGFQLFFDFAGYSHIVIGAARLFGFRLDENFASPFMAATPSEFWTRWHMSLSSWIRDYVFVPVAAVRRDVWWRYFALFFSMTLFGLWHGVNIMFALWGMYQGILLILHRLIQQARRQSNWNIPAFIDGGLSWAVTFVAISAGWIFFRANSLQQAFGMFGSLLDPRSYLHPQLSSNYYLLLSTVMIAFFAYHMIYMPVWQRMLAAITPRLRIGLAQWGLTGEFATFVGLIPMLAILLLGMLIVHSGSDAVSPFVYAVF